MNFDVMLTWMQQRKGKVKYSMNHRNGPDSYDCSSSVYSALVAGGFLPVGTQLGNTETLFVDLERNGWQQVKPINGNYPAKRGDIFIWGKRGSTLGAAGHTGFFSDDKDNIIHCNFGYNGITINSHDLIWQYNGRPPITIYRRKGVNISSKPNNHDVPRFAKGQMVKVLPHATHYQTGQAVPLWVKNRQYPILQIKSVKNTGSKHAYLLAGIMSWVLEQDVD